MTTTDGQREHHRIGEVRLPRYTHELVIIRVSVSDSLLVADATVAGVCKDAIDQEGDGTDSGNTVID
jgi:hypothetical protein